VHDHRIEYLMYIGIQLALQLKIIRLLGRN
jgi:hypothetical protein